MKRWWRNTSYVGSSWLSAAQRDLGGCYKGPVQSSCVMLGPIAPPPPLDRYFQTKKMGEKTSRPKKWMKKKLSDQGPKREALKIHCWVYFSNFGVTSCSKGLLFHKCVVHLFTCLTSVLFTKSWRPTTSLKASTSKDFSKETMMRFGQTGLSDGGTWHTWNV